MRGTRNRMLSLLLALCVTVGLLTVQAVAAGGLVDTSRIVDIYLNVGDDTDVDALKSSITAKLVGQDKTWADGTSTTLTADNIRFLTNVTAIDVSNLTDWYVYDHYDTSYFGNQAAWEAGLNYSAVKNASATAPAEKYFTYGETEAKRPYFGETENYGEQKTIIGNLGNLDTFKSSSKVREHIYAKGTGSGDAADMIFVGYGASANVDFLFYPTENAGNKTVSFQVNSSGGNTHSMDGVGFLLNTGIDESGCIHGYVLYYKLSGDSENGNKINGCSSVTLYKIKDNVSASSFHSASNNITNFCTAVAAVSSPAWSTSVTSIKLEISSTGVKILHDKNGGENYTVVANFSGKMADENRYGFGPLVNYSGHNCEDSSYFTFSSLTMAFEQTDDSILSPLYASQFMQGTERYFINTVDTRNPLYSANTVKDVDKPALATMANGEIRYITDELNPFVDALGRNGYTYTGTGSFAEQCAAYMLGQNAWAELQTPVSGSDPVAAMSLAVNSTDPTADSVAEGDTAVPVDIINRHLGDGTSIFAKDLSQKGTVEDLTITYTLTDPSGNSSTIEGTAGGYTKLFAVTADSPKGVYTVTQTVSWENNGPKTSVSTMSFVQINVDSTAPTAMIGTVSEYAAPITLVNTPSADEYSYTSDLASYYWLVDQTPSHAPSNADDTKWEPYTTADLGQADLSADAVPGTNYVHVFVKDAAGNVGVASKLFEKPCTVTIEPNGGSIMGESSVEYGHAIPSPGIPTREGYTFLGWFSDPDFRTAWNFSADTATSDVTLYAKWVKDTVKTYTVGGTVQVNSSPISPVSGATVELYKGTEKLAATVTATDGTYSFGSIEKGTYNIVVTSGGKTKTATASVAGDAESVTVDVVLPDKSVSSEVDYAGEPVEDSRIDPVGSTVSGLDTIAESEIPAPSEHIKITLTVTPKEDVTDSQVPADEELKTQQTAIQTEAGGRTVEYLDLSLTKTTTGGINPGEVNIGSANDKILTITIPFNTRGLTNIAVYRYHGSQVDTLTTTPVDGEYITIAPDSVTVYAKKFSTYAIGYTVPATPGSSGGGYSAYPISVPNSKPDGGKVSVSPRNAEKGDTVTITVAPDSGYTLDKLTVTAKDGKEIPVTAKGNGKYTFTMPAGKVTVSASFVKIGDAPCGRADCPAGRFTDTSVTAWYHDGVHYCVENGLMVGYGNESFRPNGSTTRAMFTVMLWRLNGSPVVNYALDFADVEEGAWYTEAVRWAAPEGVAGGYGNGKFGPNDTLTREQMVTILWRYAKQKNVDVSVGEDTNILSYNDAFSVGEYAIPAMQWACGSGTVQGTTDGRLDPKGSATRAQAAAILMRYCENIVK